VIEEVKEDIQTAEQQEIPATVQEEQAVID
jgi:hypothetical protein